MDTPRRRLGDRRGRPRFEIVGQLWGALEAVESLELRDIGRGGALLESSVPLPTDSVHRVRFSSASLVSEVQVRVRHVRPAPTAGRFLVGLEFLVVPPPVLEQIDRVMGLVRTGPTDVTPSVS